GRVGRAAQRVVHPFTGVEPLRRCHGPSAFARCAFARGVVSQALVAILDRFGAARGRTFRELRCARVFCGCGSRSLGGSLLCSTGAPGLFLLLRHRRLYTTCEPLGDKTPTISFWLPRLWWRRRELVGEGHQGEGFHLHVLIGEQGQGEGV